MLERNEELFEYRKKELVAEIDGLLSEIARKEKALQDFVETYRDRDLSGLTESYHEAFELFLQGKVDAALAILDESCLGESERQLAEKRVLRAEILLSEDRQNEAEENYIRAAEICLKPIYAFYLPIPRGSSGL